MGRRYHLLRGPPAEKKALQRALRKEIEGRVAAFVEGEATTITTGVILLETHMRERAHCARLEPLMSGVLTWHSVPAFTNDFR